MKIFIAIFFLHSLIQMILSEKTNYRLSHHINGNANGPTTAKRHKHWPETGIPLEGKQTTKEKRANDNHVLEEFKDPIVFPNEATMLKMGAKAKIGAIAYVEDGKFFGKSSRGWSPFEMGPPIKNIQEEGDGGNRNEVIVPPTLITKIGESKMEKMDISESNFDKHRLSKENESITLITYGALKLVALDKPSNGNMGGMKNANYKCQRAATAFELDGIFRAFLGSKSLNLAEILNPVISFNFKIVNIKNETLFDSYDSLRKHTGKWATIANHTITPIYSFTKKNVIYDEDWPINMVWHGPARNDYISSNYSDCNEWTSSTSNDSGMASDFLYKGLFHSQNETCDEEFIVLCLETGVHHQNKKISQDEYLKILDMYEAQYSNKHSNGVDEESSLYSSQSDSNYEEDHTERTDSADSEIIS